MVYGEATGSSTSGGTYVTVTHGMSTSPDLVLFCPTNPTVWSLITKTETTFMAYSYAVSSGTIAGHCYWLGIILN